MQRMQIKKTWLEVALNGGWTRALQPRIPVTVDEIIADGVACVRAGAGIVHLHAYDEATGRQRDDADLYARIIEGIRSQVDAIVYPTIEGSAPPNTELSKTGPERYHAVETLAERGLIEWSVVDPGTVNTSAYASIKHNRPGTVYLNPESDIRFGLALAERYGFHPSYAIYEPGFLRMGAALAARYTNLKPPIYRFMFSDGFTFGFAPRAYALDAYLASLDEYAPGAPWMIAGLMADMAPLITQTVERGGHVRTGLEDVMLGSKSGNVELVEAAADAITRAGGTLASAAEVRAALAGV
jgi:3-keto-5-aminohexanoate cleavage enzyme